MKHGVHVREIINTPKPVTCQWFLRCGRVAVTTVAHPILGQVPCCQRCSDFANAPLPRPA